MSSPKVGRRRFLKYLGGAVVAAGAGYYLYDKQRAHIPTTSQATTITSTSQPMSSTSVKTNSSPVVSEINVKPACINPTTEYAVELTCDVHDPDNDPLQTTWLIDGKEVSREGKYSTKLSEGAHDIVLKVYDVNDRRTLSETTRYRAITVEPDQIYPTKQLYIKHKGMRIMVGWKGMASTPIDITDEKLDIIHDELGCNAVYIYGNTELEDDLVEAGRVAIEKKFDRIYVAPLYLDLTIEETAQKIGEFAKKVKALREISDSIVFMVGHEFTLDSSSFVPGATYEERELNAWKYGADPKRLTSMLPAAFRKIISSCKENYGYQIAYSATMWEAENVVPWSDPAFESVGSDAYVWNKIGWTEKWVLGHLDRLKGFGKPVNSTEWGCQTYKNASEDWQITAGMEKYPYDEDEQARYIDRYCEMLNKAKINGCLYTALDDERPKGYGLYKASRPPYFGPGSSRKKGFYMYKSYQRVT